MRKLLFILGLFVAAGLAYYCLTTHSVKIENEITDRVAQAYGGESTPEDFAFIVDGRDVTLTGMVDNVEEKTRLGSLAATLEGVRVVNNNLSYEGEEIPVAAVEEEFDLFEDDEIEVATLEEPEIELDVLDPEAEADLNEIEAAAGAAEPVVVDNGPKVMANACQENLARVLENETINFDSNKASIKKSSYGTLNRIVNQAKKCERAYINVHGHTDSTGPTMSNKQLSLLRAQAVGQYLMKHDVRQGIKAYGHGESQPVANNGTRDGRAKNRRIEFKVQPLEN